MLAAILAAIMSTVASQLLVTASAVVEDMYRSATGKRLIGNAGMNAGRMVVLAISVVAAALAWARTDSILGLVAFAWAGFGASFGPIILLSLYWRKLNVQGALVGMIAGAATTVIWHQFPILAGAMYEIAPGFAVNLILAWMVSTITWKPQPEIEAEFDEALRLLTASESELREYEKTHAHTEPIMVPPGPNMEPKG